MADGLSRGDAARSSKLRLLRHANAARGWDCRGCVCAGVHWHCQGTQPHSTRITTRAFHSNLNCISCIIVSWSRVGGISLNFALLDAVSLVCSSAVSSAACYSIAPSLSLAENELFWQFAHGMALPAWSPFPLFLSSPLSAATGPMPVVSGVPSPRGFGAAVIAAPGKTQIPQQQIWGKLAAEVVAFFVIYMCYL